MFSIPFAFLGGAMVFILVIVGLIAFALLIGAYVTGAFTTVAQEAVDDGDPPRPAHTRPTTPAAEHTQFVDPPSGA